MKKSLLLIASLVALAGCGSDEPEIEPVKDARAQIEKVRNDPSIPDAKKDLYIRQLEARAAFDQASAKKNDPSAIRPTN